MGRWYYWNKKTTTEEVPHLSIFQLNKWKLLGGYASNTLTWSWRLSGRKSSIGIIVNTVAPYVRLQYTQTDREGNRKDFDYKVSLTTTPCHFGGVRHWFNCPNCGKRVGYLYCARHYFTCRTCANLTYESRNESRLGRFGQMGYFIVAERQMEERYMNLKRRYYAGKPTRKYRQILKIQNRLDSINIPTMEELLFRGK